MARSDGETRVRGTGKRSLVQRRWWKSPAGFQEIGVRGEKISGRICKPGPTLAVGRPLAGYDGEIWKVGTPLRDVRSA